MRPFGIDVSSGVEARPGIKDHARLAALVRGAERDGVSESDDLVRRGAIPDARGYFGEFGGRFVPETLVAPVEELERAYFAARDDPAFPPSSSGC